MKPKIRFCIMCKLRRLNTRPVGEVSEGPCPGSRVYACGPCIDHHGITPLEERECEEKTS